MSSGQKPRTPRYFPRMKVRGARRKQQRHIYAIQRFADASEQAARSLEVFFVTLGKHLKEANVTRITDYVNTDGINLRGEHGNH